MIAYLLLDGSGVEVRADDEEDGGSTSPCHRWSDDGVGRGEGGRIEQHRDVDATHQRWSGALQERLQDLQEQPWRRWRATLRESLALAQNSLPCLCDRGVSPLDHSLYPAGPVSDPVIATIRFCDLDVSPLRLRFNWCSAKLIGPLNDCKVLIHCDFLSDDCSMILYARLTIWWIARSVWILLHSL